jgi:quinoprotein dehydrogenase-associated probable ABC transporter substrate-binding protein
MASGRLRMTAWHSPSRPGFRAGLLALAAAAGAPPQPAAAVPAEPASPPAILSVCADPANLPYSNEKREGFENRIAALVADDMQAKLRYFWFAEHRSFFRRTLLDEVCDVVIAAPVGLKGVTATKPYFASVYVAVTRADDKRHFTSFDDPWLREARIGLQLVGKEGATTPPAVALAHRGINQRIVPFEMWADQGDPAPQGRIIDAVADGNIDVALVWGPFAGYFAKAHGAALRIEPIAGDPEQPEVQFAFPMAMVVRKADTALRDRLQAALDRHPAEIAAILKDYDIPTAPAKVTPVAAPGAGPGTARPNP